jgi:tetratricopeptide (TPR) repeat protein
VKASSILEPQQFGSWLHEPFLARASEPGAEHGRHALGAFLTLRLADRFRPDEEPSHPLALAYQIRATRDYLLDLHPQNAEVKHLLEVVRLAEAVQKGRARSLLWPPLLAFAHWLEQELRLEEALDTVETTLGLNDGTASTEEVAALLQRGRILRQLGRLEEARTSYQAGRTKAHTQGDAHSELLGRIGDAIVVRQLGNLPESERALRGILADAQTIQDRDAQARAHHDLGAVLVHRERAREAVLHLYSAFEFYERLSDRLRALSDVGEVFKREGRYDAAQDAFELVLETGSASVQIRVPAMIALLELAGLTQDRVSFTRWSKAIEAVAEDLPLERSVDYRLQLGRGFATFGNKARAVGSLRHALRLAEEHHLNEYAFKAQTELAATEAKPARHRITRGVPCRAGQAVEERAFAEVAGKLHALRAG